MCGLTGFWQDVELAEPEMLRLAQRMSDTLTHRGPDERGVWADPAAGVALGFRRLSVIDLSSTGHQPMLSSSGRYVVVFNGEIYNHPDLKTELLRLGHRFRGTSDTEVLVEGADAWGAEALVPRLWGMFALALWDRKERRLLLARDRLGKKPLYYANSGGLLVFGSELKALRVHPGFPAEVDHNALAAYFRFGYVPSPHCIYRNTFKLSPGTYALVSAGRSVDVRRYWDPRGFLAAPIDPSSVTDDEGATDELEALLKDAVARRMVSDVPLGALLSGGVDSSMVVAMMQCQSARPVKTFTVGFHDVGYNEADAARSVAEHLGTDHTEICVTPEDALAVVPKLPELYDEPFADASQVPTYLVCSLARRQVTVSLSGDGGDELFAGYTRYALASQLWRRMRFCPLSVRRGLGKAIKKVSAANWERLYGALEPLLPHRYRLRLFGDKLHKLAEVLPVDTPEALYYRLVSQWKHPAELVLRGSEPTPLHSDPAFSFLSPDFTEQMMLLDLMTYLPDDILVKVDRASMGVSLEARCPLLDHRLVEWVCKLPLRMKKRDGSSKWLLKRLLYRHVPPSLIERPKMGFGLPVGLWLRGPLKDWAESLLDERLLRQQGYLNPAPIREAWQRHLRGRHNEEYRLWVVLMFQSWYQRWLT
jgi:asparagine synthase (glutamine-hydrolysing)